MQITNETIQDVLVLQIDGRLDTISSRRFESALKIPMSRGVKKIVVDLSGLTSINSVGLRLLMTTAKEMVAKEGILVLCSPVEQVRQVLDISGFSRVMSITETLDEALDQCNVSQA